MVQIESELVRLLMRVGYTAAWNGFHQDAISIFDGVGAVRPESEIPVIGAAVVAMLSGHADVAVKTLEDGALPLNPKSQLVRAHLGAALRLRGDEDAGISILRAVAAQTEDLDAARMAANVMSMPIEQLKPSLNSTRT